MTNITWDNTLSLPDSVATPDLTVAYSYDTSGRIVSRTETDTTTFTTPYPTSGETRTWAYTYYPNGLLETVDGPLTGSANTVSYTYDSHGYVATFTNELGQVYTVQTTNGRGLPETIGDPNGIVTDVAYDAMGRTTSMTDDPTGLNATTQVAYDAAGNIIKAPLQTAAISLSNMTAMITSPKSPISESGGEKVGHGSGGIIPFRAA